MCQSWSSNLELAFIICLHDAQRLMQADGTPQCLGATPSLNRSEPADATSLSGRMSKLKTLIHINHHKCTGGPGELIRPRCEHASLIQFHTCFINLNKTKLWYLFFDENKACSFLIHCVRMYLDTIQLGIKNLSLIKSKMRISKEQIKPLTTCDSEHIYIVRTWFSN